MLSNNEQNERKSRITALAGTLLFHALILGILMLLAFHTDFPMPAEKGIEVNFNNFGGDTNVKPQKLQLAPDNESTSNQEETDAKILFDVKSKTNTTKKKEAVKPAPSKSKISIIETPDESTLIHRMPNTGKITKISSSTTPVITGKQSDQLKQNDTKSLSSNENSSEKGSSISFELGRRAALILPKPSFNSSEDGIIVVSVKVNLEGKVISASVIAKGTTIAEPNLRKQAENAARNSLFSRDNNAPEDQRGTITFVIVKTK